MANYNIMPKRKSDSKTSVEAILQPHKPEVRELVQALRDLICETVPEAVESAHAVWHSIHYHHPKSGYFCGLFPLEEGIKLVFEFGILLSDPHKILEGTGKQTRFIHLKESQELRVEHIIELLLAAIDLPNRRADRLALLQAKARPMNH